MEQERNNQLADVSVLKGVSFISSSFNKAMIFVIGAGGIRVIWNNPHTQRDADEFDAWASQILGATPHQVRGLNRAQVAEAYRNFIKDIAQR